jgi:hypothetical protein
MTRVIAGTLLALLLPVAAQAQGLERQVYARQDATVRLSYASPPRCLRRVEREHQHE